MTKTRTSLWALLVLVLMVSALAWSCAQREQHSETRGSSEQGGPTSGAVSPGDNEARAKARDTTGSTPDTVSTVTGTLAELRTRLHAEALRLDQAVAARDFDEVGSRALRIRDLVVALEGKITGLSSKAIEEIESDIPETTQMVEKIRGFAAARDAANVKTQNADLQSIVARILELSASRS